MSHYIYKEKQFLEIDGKILPLIRYADSSVWDAYGRKHPSWWFILTLDAEPALLIDKKFYQEAAERKVQERIDWLNKHYPNDEHSLDSYNPYGDTYRGNGKLRGMKSFLSCKRTVPAEDFLRIERFSVSLEGKNKEGVNEKKSFYISSTDDIIQMDAWYRAFRAENPEASVCIGVYGLPTD